MVFDKHTSQRNRKYRYDRAVQLFESNKSKYSHPLHFAAENNHAYLIKHILSLGCDINIVDGNGHTPLQVAIINASANSIKLLIDMGCSLDNILIWRTTIDGFIKKDLVAEVELLTLHKIINPTNFNVSLKYWLIEQASEKMLILLIALGYFDVTHPEFTSNVSGILTKFVYEIAKHNQYDGRVAILMAAGINPVLYARHAIHYKGYLRKYNVNEALQHKIAELLDHGVSKEYQHEFDEEMENIRCRVDKRNVSLFTLLWQRLQI